MMNQIPRISSSLLSLSVLLFSSSVLSGCGGGEEPVKEVKKTVTKKAAPVEKLLTVDELMAEMQIDERVFLPEDGAPVTNQGRRGVLTFFDSWINGDHETVVGMLGPADGEELQAMVDDGQWASATGDQIDAVYITTGSSASGGRCVLAIYEVGELSQPQLWNYQPDGGGGLLLESVPTPPEMMGRINGDDLIAAWWKILAKEDSTWSVPDSDLNDLIIDEPESLASGSSGGGNKRSPGGGGGKRRTPGGR